MLFATRNPKRKAGPLTLPFQALNAGFIAGGLNGSTRYVGIDKLDMGSLAKSTLGSSLGTARNDLTGNSSKTKGFYIGGDIGPTALSLLGDTVDFATQTNTTTSTGISANRYCSASFDSDSNGYSISGSAAAASTNATKISFAAQSFSTLNSVYGSGVKYTAGLRSLINGYTCGGYLSTPQTSFSRFPFATETATLVANALTRPAYGMFGLSAETKGYVGSGYSGGYQALIQKMNFSTEAFSSVGTATGLTRTFSAVVRNADVGLQCGGGNNGAQYYDIRALTFSTETAVTIAARLSSGVVAAAGTQSI